MRPVTVRIMHQEPGPDAGPLTRWLAAEQETIARQHVDRFVAAGADDVAVVAGPPDGISFGSRLRTLANADRPDGLVILGSGSVPLATRSDAREFVQAAATSGRYALANNRFSADAIAIADAWPTLAALPDLPTDNALPRWLEEHAGYRVVDLRRRWRLAVDVDAPLDLLLIGRSGDTSAAEAEGIDLGPVTATIEAVRRVAADPSAELMVAGRTSATTLGWLERSTASRTRALIEERGLRTSTANQRSPASVIGALLDRDGPSSLGEHLVRLGDAAVVDTRVLMAHRWGADETAWPVAEDRFASDLLLPGQVADLWLRDLTAAARAAPIPILLGGHSLVGPGVRLVVRGSRRK
jgi:hypothetical protein